MNDWRSEVALRLQPLQRWFAGLNERERRIVVWGGVAAAILLFVGAAVLPLYAATSKTAQRVEQKREDLSWMRSVAGELRAAANTAPTAAPAAGSLIVVVDQTARRAGLGTAVTGSQPSGAGGIRVRLEGAAFDTLIGWLALLEQQHRITVESASVDRTGKPGLVNASVVLRKPE